MPHLVAYGIDELTAQLRVTSTAGYTVLDVCPRVVDALREAGWKPLSRSLRPGTASFKLTLVGIDLRFQPVGRGTWEILAYLAPELLHLDPGGTWAEALEILGYIWSLLGGTGAAPVTLRSIALHADVVGWGFDRKAAGRFHRTRRYRRRLRGDEDEFTGVSFGKALIAYDKTEEVRRHPRKGWIRSLWDRSPHYAPGMQVWRVETRWEPTELRLLGTSSLDALWITRLGEFSLRKLRSPKTEDPVWELLRTIKFLAPWAVPPCAAPVRPLDSPRTRNLAIGRFLSSLAALIAFDDLPCLDVREDAYDLTEGLLQEKPSALTELRARVDDRRRRLGKPPLKEEAPPENDHPET